MSRPPRKSHRDAALAAVRSEGAYGVTSRELEDAPGLDYYGPASGALSALHRDGMIMMLKQKRGGFHIYVLFKFVQGRPLQERKTNPWKALNAELKAEIKRLNAEIKRLESQTKTRRVRRPRGI